MRGEFIRGDGLMIPNNVTLAGSYGLLASAFQGIHDTRKLGLCSAVYTPDMIPGDVEEPTVGVGGYDRLTLVNNLTDWPVNAQLNNEQYVESKACVFTATGAGFDKPIQRLVLFSSAITAVLALSGVLPAELTITTATPIELRTFKYRFYLR